jgi:hypothetical protein
MEKVYFLRCLSAKGKLKTPKYDDGTPVAEWRIFNSEAEAIKFAEEFNLKNFTVLHKYIQVENIQRIIE